MKENIKDNHINQTDDVSNDILCIDNAYLMQYNIDRKSYLRRLIYMSNTRNFSLRIDSDVKAKSEAVFKELGINLTTAINIFLRQSIREGGFPFEVKIKMPNKETIEAMLEAKRMEEDPNTKRYSLEEALEELKSENILD